VNAEFLGCTEQLVYVAFPVTDVDASGRVPERGVEAVDKSPAEATAESLA